MRNTHIRTKKLFNTLLSASIVIVLVASMSITSGFAYTSQSLGEINFKNDVYEEYKDVCDKIAEGLENLESEIAIGNSELPNTQFSNVIEVVIKKHPELFYVNTSNTYAAGRNGYITVIYPVYNGENDEIAQQIAEFDKKADSVMNKVDSSMSDYEKALVLHDEIVLTCKYDTTYTARSSYDALVGGTSVCEGYVKAYSYLLSLAGIDSEYVESSSMNHAWNKVCIDDVYYNVDITWDDPIADRAGHVSHTYFLLSDEAIGSDHYGYDSDFSSDSQKYDSYIMHNIDTKFCFIGNDCYIIDNSSGSEYEKCLLKYNTETEQVIVIQKFDYRWSAGGNSYWLGGFMSLDEYNDVLYYNTPDSVIKYDPKTNEKEVLHSDNSLSGSYYGMLIKDKSIYVNIKDNPNEEGTLSRLDISLGTDDPEPTTTTPQSTSKPVPTTTPQITTEPVSSSQTTTDPENLLLGDVDMNGRVTVLDATEIQKYLADLVVLNDEQISVADFNGDGRINIRDATAIQYYLVNN